MNETITAFLSGNNYPYAITTFNWTTMDWKIHPVQLNGNRGTCGCGLLRKNNGELLVAAAGKDKNNKKT